MLWIISPAKHNWNLIKLKQANQLVFIAAPTDMSPPPCSPPPSICVYVCLFVLPQGPFSPDIKGNPFVNPSLLTSLLYQLMISCWVSDTWTVHLRSIHLYGTCCPCDCCWAPQHPKHLIVKVFFSDTAPSHAVCLSVTGLKMTPLAKTNAVSLTQFYWQVKHTPHTAEAIVCK